MQPPAGCCAVWLRRRRSFCCEPLSGGSQFCSQHVDQYRGRVPCPRDGRHTVLQSRLQSHLKVCTCGAPSRWSSEPEEASSAYVEPGTNAGDSEVIDIVSKTTSPLLRAGACPAEVCAATRCSEIVSELGRRIVAALRECGACGEPVPPTCTVVLEPAGLVPLDLEDAGETATQVASIASHVLRYSPRSSSNQLVELCAGTGRLSNEVLQRAPGTIDKVWLVDKQTRFRRRGVHDAALVPVRCDLRDLRLSMLLGPGAGSVLACGKHLCGAAADYALRACVRCEEDLRGEAHRHRLAFSLCCHHLCEWQAYVNKPMLVAHGIGKGEFALLRKLSTKYRAHPWMQACDRVTEGTRGEVLSLPHSRKGKHPLCSEGGRHAALCAEVGILGKRLLNEGRAAWLRSQPGWDGVRLVRYVESLVSPENQLLVASSQPD